MSMQDRPESLDGLLGFITAALPDEPTVTTEDRAALAKLKAKKRELEAQQEAKIPGVAQYRKRPVVVDALQWTGENIVAALNFFDAGRGTTVVNINAPADRSKGWIEIPTLEGKMRASVGDWIIRGVQGEFYPCREDIFRATYEAVEG
ncbi:hypothetical protein [Streptomyces fagopyri]